MARKIGADCGAGEENKMEESEVKERKRKPNFSPLEVSIITESVKKHIDVIQSNLTNNITNKKKSLGGDYQGVLRQLVRRGQFLAVGTFFRVFAGQLEGTVSPPFCFVLTKFFPRLAS